MDAVILQHRMDSNVGVKRKPRRDSPDRGKKVRKKQGGFDDPKVRDRRWVVVINNWTEADFDNIVERTDVMKYGIWGAEIGGNLHTPHLQCFFYFTNPQFRSTVCRWFPESHCEIAHGSNGENKVYCSKDNQFWEFGLCPGEKEAFGVSGGEAMKSKWDAARDLAKKGKFDEIDSQIYISHMGSLHNIHAENVQQLSELENLPEPCGLWLYGPTGCGKSHYVSENFPNRLAKNLNKWFGSCQGTQPLSIEDVDPTHWMFARFFKVWADKYPFPTEVKGTHGYARPSQFIVTSQYTIEEVFGRAGQNDVDALKRRFTIYKFTGRGVFVVIPRHEPVFAMPEPELPPLPFNPKDYRNATIVCRDKALRGESCVFDGPHDCHDQKKAKGHGPQFAGPPADFYSDLN